MFTYVDVLERAIQIIRRSSPPFSWSDHGGCCPWCAVAIAKGELDDENGTGVSFSKTLEDYLYGEVEEVDSDEPLVFARKALGQWNDIDPYSITREQAIKILSQAKSVVLHPTAFGVGTQSDLPLLSSSLADDQSAINGGG